MTFLSAFAGLGNAYRRLLGVALAVAGPALAYRITAWLALALYRSLEPLSMRTRSQCRAAMRGRLPEEEIDRIAEQSFVHRIWNLTDLMLADRWLHPGTYHRYGGRISQEFSDLLLQARAARHPVILVTAYYGPYDLLPVFLGYNGVRVTAVYRRHPNRVFDAFRTAVRSRSGCEMVPVERAAGRLTEVLEQGGVVALVADHDAPSRGIPTSFLGLPTRTPPVVAILAQRYSATVAVAGVRRLHDRFRFEIHVADVIRPEQWRGCPDPAGYITRRYQEALERIVLADPVQYLWAQDRWGTHHRRPVKGSATLDAVQRPGLRVRGRRKGERNNLSGANRCLRNGALPGPTEN